MDQPEDSWQNEARAKLAEVFEERPEDLCRILFFLDEADKAYADDKDQPYSPFWKSLKVTLKNNEAFKMLAEKFSKDTKTAEKDQEFRLRMSKVYEEMMEHCEDPVGIEEYQKLDKDCVTRKEVPASAFGGLASAWHHLPVGLRAGVVSCIKQVAKDPRLMCAVDDLVSLATKPGATVVLIGLSAVYLTYDAYVNIQRWWKGEISGKRCIKNVLDTTCTVGAGVAGGFAGAAIGLFATANPIGSVVGGIVGGCASSAAAAVLSDYLTQWLFGLPKDVALENAYRHLGVEMTASNAEVNTAFRKLCLSTHPDKPRGTIEKFIILQCNMATIKLARGEF